MKNILIITYLLVFPFFAIAQNQPVVGDILIINEPSGQYYNHIAFPQLNILVKRGKTASYKPIYNSKVIIEEVVTKDNNKTYVILKKKDGTKFFGFKSKVKADYPEALKSGELSITK